MKTVKIIKKTGKIILISLLSLFLLLIIIIVIALNSENAITKLALKEVSKIIEAPVKVDKVTLHLFRDFPFATVEFQGFKLGGFKGAPLDSAYTTNNDTIISLRKLFISVKTKPLLKNIIVIEKVEIEGFAFNYLVDSTGASNIDFLLTADSTQVEEIPTDTTEFELDVLLRNLIIRDINVNFTDESLKATACIQIPEMDINGRVLNSYYAGKISGQVMLSNLSFEDTNLHLMQETSMSFMVDYEDGSINFESLLLKTDGAILSATGKAVLGDSIYVDMGVDLTEVNLKKLIKYAPKEMLEELGILELSGHIDLKTKIVGYVYDTLLLPRVDASISMKRGKIATTEYPEIKHLSFTGDIVVLDPNDLSAVTTNFRDIRVATNKSYFDLAFSASNLDKPRYNLKTSGLINFDEFTSFIPDSTVEYLTGTMAFNMATRGVLPDDIGMESADYFIDRTSLEVKLRNFSTALDSVDEVKNLNVDFSYKPNRHIALKNLSLEAPGYDVSLQNSFMVATILGYVRDMDNMGLDIESCFLQMGSNIITGKAKVQGLVKTTFEIDTEGTVLLEELLPFIPDSIADHISGKIEFALKSYGTVHIDTIDDYVMPIAFEQSTVKAKVRDFNFTMFDDTLAQVQNLSMDFEMANDTIKVDNFYANAHGIDLWADSTEVWNVYKAFLLEQKNIPIIVQTHIRVSDIDYDKFAHIIEEETPEDGEQSTTTVVPIESQNTDKQSSNSTEAEEPMYIPPYIVRGTMAANSVKYGDIMLRNLSTLFRVDDSLYIIDKFKLDAFGGSMITSLVYDTRSDSLEIVQFRNEIFGMDIHQMLVDGDNFGQDDFTHENIKGRLTSSLDGRVVMQDTTIFYDRILMRGNLKLEDGEITNFEPLMEVGKFTNLRELENLVFRTLETSIFIHRNNIYFPKTDIVSSAIDMSAMGVQSFDDDYQYHMTIFLGDVLLGKSDNLLKQQGMEKDGFKGEDQSQRRGLYLVAMDRDGQKRHRWDQPALRRRMTSQINVQGIGLGMVFNPRLVNYSTDLDRREGQTRTQTGENK